MSGLTRIAAAIVVAGAMVAWAVFSRPAPREIGRYSFNVSGDWIQRFDTITGEALVCDKQRCIAADEDGERDTYLANETADNMMNRLDRE